MSLISSINILTVSNTFEVTCIATKQVVFLNIKSNFFILCLMHSNITNTYTSCLQSRALAHLSLQTKDSFMNSPQLHKLCFDPSPSFKLLNKPSSSIINLGFCTPLLSLFLCENLAMFKLDMTYTLDDLILEFGGDLDSFQTSSFISSKAI